MARTIGEVQNVKSDMEWKIANYFSLPGNPGNFFYSSKLKFADTEWMFKIYPNGESEADSSYISLYLVGHLWKDPVNLAWSWALKTVDGKNVQGEIIRHTFKKIGRYERGPCYKFLKNAILSEKESPLLLSDTLTIVCSLANCCTSTSEADNRQEFFEVAEYVCAVCRHKERDTLLEPCGHTFCNNCINTVKDCAAKNNCEEMSCPYCKQRIQKTKRIYLT